VEPILSLSLSGASTSPGHSPNPHLVPRGKGSEALDQSVPSVLDSAVEVLASSPSGDIDALADVAVLAPASSGLAQSLSAILTPSAGSPVRSRGASPMRSRSPSPLRRLSGVPSSLEQSLLGASISSSISPTRPTIDTQATLTQVPRLNDTSNGTDAPSTSSSPTTTTLERAPALPTPTPAATFNIQGSANPNVAIPRPSPPRSPGAADRLGAPPSPSRASKRLSFLSYADLLSSTPASTVPLAALTSSAGTEPPPHLPSVLGLAAAAQDGRHAGSSASSVHGVPLGNSPIGTGHGHGFGASGHAARGQRESVLLVPGEEAGGEWEREGLGMGLEERMEVLLGSPVASPVAGKA
jgi:hypothetical protein